jgi:hypothetical protein
MTPDPRLPGPIVWALGGALVAVLGLVLPQLWFGATAMGVADDMPVIAMALVSLYGQQSMQAWAHAARLWGALVIGLFGAVSTGLAAYVLYTVGQPGLLAARLAYRTTVDPQRMAHLEPAHWLDPAAQALQLAASVLFFSFVIGAFAAFRARKAQGHRPT